MPVGSPVARWTGTGTRRRFASREGNARSPRTSAVPDRPVRLHGADGAFGSTECFAPLMDVGGSGSAACGRRDALQRSEEHTSALQSLIRISYAVFSLTQK